jgi:hypothetical protein
MFLKRLLSMATLLTLAMGLLLAQSPDTTLTIAVTGTLGPVLQGPDPLNANGHTGTLTVRVSESASPIISNSRFAAYVLPIGAVTAVIGSQPFTTTTPSKMTIQLGSNADILSVVYRSQNSTTTRFTASLAGGSFSTGVLMHPTAFSPSPQNLTSATSAGGAGSQLWYTDQGALTVLGLTGSISNSATPTPPAPQLGPEP